MITELKQLPHSLEAEQMLLGGILLDGCLDKVNDILSSEMFYRKEHQAIYRNMFDLFSKKVTIDTVTIYNSFNEDEQNHWQLFDYLNNLADATANSDNIEHYARIIQDKYKLREVISKANQCSESCYNANSTNVNEIITNTVNHFISIQNAYSTSMGINYADSVLEYIQHIHTHKKEFIKTNDQLLDDKLLGGFARGELVILAAKPGMGKSAVAINMFANMNKTHKAIFFSLEMSMFEISERLFSNYTETNISDGFTDQSITDLSENLALSNSLAIVDNSRITIETLKRYIVDYKVKHATIDVIFIDYLQLMSRPQKMSEYEFLSYLTRELKLLAQEMKIVIVCLSQLNRSHSGMKEKRPVLSNLRGSGSIEQDADYVIFLYREAYYLQEQGKNVPIEVDNVLEFICAKARSKSPFKILYNCDLKHSKITRIDTSKGIKYNQYVATNMKEEDEKW